MVNHRIQVKILYKLGEICEKISKTKGQKPDQFLMKKLEASGCIQKGS